MCSFWSQSEQGVVELGTPLLLPAVGQCLPWLCPRGGAGGVGRLGALEADPFFVFPLDHTWTLPTSAPTSRIYEQVLLGLRLRPILNPGSCHSPHPSLLPYSTIPPRDTCQDLPDP